MASVETDPPRETSQDARVLSFVLGPELQATDAQPGNGLLSSSDSHSTHRLIGPQGLGPRAWALEYGRRRPYRGSRSNSWEDRRRTRRALRRAHSDAMYDSAMEETDGEPEMGPPVVPSIFQKLMEEEGHEAAIDKLEQWENRFQERALHRQQKREASVQRSQLSMKQRINEVRRIFSGKLRWLSTSLEVMSFLESLETAFIECFTSKELDTDMSKQKPMRDDSSSWALRWEEDKMKFVTETGVPPASTLEAVKLLPIQRKLVHRFARALGLNSLSVDPQWCNGSELKAVLFRPSRAQVERRFWTPPVEKVMPQFCNHRFSKELADLEDPFPSHEQWEVV